jgi:hypothetical protein
MTLQSGGSIMSDEDTFECRAAKAELLNATNQLRALSGYPPLSALPEPPFCGGGGALAPSSACAPGQPLRAARVRTKGPEYRANLRESAPLVQLGCALPDCVCAQLASRFQSALEAFAPRICQCH